MEKANDGSADCNDGTDEGMAPGYTREHHFVSAVVPLLFGHPGEQPLLQVWRHVDQSIFRS